MTRSHGRCPKGERLGMGFPHGHRKITSLVAGLRMTGAVAGGPINGDWFEAYVTHVLVPECAPSATSSWTMCRATSAPRGVGADRGSWGKLALPPALQPRLQPIERNFARL